MHRTTASMRIEEDSSFEAAAEAEVDAEAETDEDDDERDVHSAAVAPSAS